MGKTRTSGMGRPKGVPNKITSDLKAMIEGALHDVGGREYLTQQAKANPAAFMTLVGKVLPKDIHMSGSVDLKLCEALLELKRD